jgi:hypothetical protein
MSQWHPCFQTHMGPFEGGSEGISLFQGVAGIEHMGYEKNGFTPGQGYCLVNDSISLVAPSDLSRLCVFWCSTVGR